MSEKSFSLAMAMVIPKGPKGDKGDPGDVESINSKTGAVTLDAGDLAYDSSETYDNGTIGAELGDVKSDISNLEEYILGVYPQETVSDRVALIPDGADEIPVKSAAVDITPAQDTHRYSPFPAGASNNLIPDGKDTSNGYVSGSYLENDGTTGTGGSYYISEYFPITEGASYTFSSNNAELNVPAVCFYDSNKDFISGVNAGQALPKTITAPVGAVYCRASQWANMVTFITNGIQLEAGDTATTVKPYSNICPISGWTGANIWRHGENLYHKESYSNISTLYIQFQGVHTGTTADSTKKARGLYLLKDATYYIYCATGQSKQWNINYTVNGDTSNHNIITNSTRTKWEGTFSPPKDGYYCFWMYSAQGWSGFTIDGIKFSIEVGTSYETTKPSTMQKYSFDWTTEAGTVYGGELDLLSGVLTVKYGSCTVNDLSWQMYNTAFYATKSDIQHGVSKVDIKCERYATADAQSGTGSASSWSDYTIRGNSGDSAIIYIKDTSYESAAAFKTAQKDMLIVYPLATPVTYQLTPQDIKTLLGFNTIFADTGDVSLTYRVDPTMHSDARIAAIELMLTANRESTMVASTAYSEGDLIIVSGVLYKATTSIANGATLTPNTNISETTIAAELAAT